MVSKLCGVRVNGEVFRGRAGQAGPGANPSGLEEGSLGVEATALLMHCSTTAGAPAPRATGHQQGRRTSVVVCSRRKMTWKLAAKPHMTRSCMQVKAVPHQHWWEVCASMHCMTASCGAHASAIKQHACLAGAPSRTKKCSGSWV